MMITKTRQRIFTAFLSRLRSDGRPLARQDVARAQHLPSRRGERLQPISLANYSQTREMIIPALP